MIKIGILVIAVAVVLPVVALSGIPGLSSAWLDGELGGVPFVIWSTICWFAILTIAAWLPESGGHRG